MRNQTVKFVADRFLRLEADRLFMCTDSFDRFRYPEVSWLAQSSAAMGYNNVETQGYRPGKRPDYQIDGRRDVMEAA